MNDEIILGIFDKASGYADGWADYKEIEPIRNEFIRLIKQVRKIEAKAFCSQFSKDQLDLINKAIKDEESS